MYIRAFTYYNQLSNIQTTEINEDLLPPCGGTCHETSQRGLRCGGGRSNFAIDWKGTMTPCTDLTEIRAYPLTDGFDAAWSKVNQEANNWPRVPECNGCAYEGVCNKCAASMLRYADPGKMPTRLCEKTKAFVRYGIRHIPECEPEI